MAFPKGFKQKLKAIKLSRMPSTATIIANMEKQLKALKLSAKKDEAAAKKKAADKKKAAIPMIAITGNARNYSMDDFKAAGFNDFLAKPLNFDSLVSQVKALTE